MIYSTAGLLDVLPPTAKQVLGQYREDGWNHGKRIYRRVVDRLNKFHPDAVIFYWDERDGYDRLGWWIGTHVAGDVWARNVSTAPIPPDRGWQCPVDGPEQDHIRCVQPLTRLIKEEPGLRREIGRSGSSKEEAVRPPAAHRFLVKEEVRDEAESSRSQPFARKRPRDEDDADHRVASPVRQHQRRLSNAGPAPQTFTLISRLGSGVPRSSRHLLGDYVHQGFSRARRAYCKKGDRESPSGAVWLYCDDEGWKFADKIRGRHQFGLNRQTSELPPRTGWQVPPHEPARADLALMLNASEEKRKEDLQCDWRRRHQPPPLSSTKFETFANQRMANVDELVVKLEASEERAIAFSQKTLDNNNDDNVPVDLVREVITLLRGHVADVERGIMVASQQYRPIVKLERPPPAKDGEELLGRLQQSLLRLQDELARAEEQLERIEWVELERWDVEQQEIQEEEDSQEECEAAGRVTSSRPQDEALGMPAAPFDTAEKDSQQSSGKKEKELAAREEGLRCWVDAVNSLAAGDPEMMARCRDHIRARILRGHREGNLGEIDWYAEPLPEIWPHQI